MRVFDFVCPEHPEEIFTVESVSLREVPFEERTCEHCGQLMERYFGKANLEIALKGANWPKRDIKETARRVRRSRVLGDRQDKIWRPRMPKLNLDQDVQKSFKEELVRKGTPLTVKKI